MAGGVGCGGGLLDMADRWRWRRSSSCKVLRGLAHCEVF